MEKAIQKLPTELKNIIFCNLHQLMLRESIEIINKIRLSDCEDLPDLIPIVDTYSYKKQVFSDPPGWSGRVTEFLEKVL